MRSVRNAQAIDPDVIALSEGDGRVWCSIRNDGVVRGRGEKRKQNRERTD